MPICYILRAMVSGHLVPDMKIFKAYYNIWVAVVSILILFPEPFKQTSIFPISKIFHMKFELNKLSGFREDF